MRNENIERVKTKMETMKEIVKKVLEDYPETRANDDKLRVIVLEKMGVDTGKSFFALALSGELKCIESITRARRKVQEIHPELKEPGMAEIRLNEEEAYHFYFRG